VVVRCVSRGELNIYGIENPGPVPSFIISLDGGLTFSPVLTPNDDGFLGYQKGGFSVKFANGTPTPSFAIGDVWTFSTEPSPDILRFLSAASRFIDGKLKNTYATPLSRWGDDLTLITCQIARWFMLQRRGMDKNQDFVVYEPKDAFKWLEETGQGDNQADVTENGTGFVFPEWMVASSRFGTSWRF
jgi:phage gp36-like protein